MLLGFHHVTAIASDPQRNLDFYAGFLGMTLVKRTVNFDDPGTHHFYFGDRTGTAGTLLTFFPWAGSVRQARRGAGQITAVGFAVSEVGIWQKKAERAGISWADSVRDGQAVLTLLDPDGLPIELLLQVPLADAPFVGPLSEITILESEAGATGDLLVRHLGFAAARSNRFTLGTARIRVVHDPKSERGVVAPGGVHHVALAIESLEEQAELRARLVAAGFKVTLRQDRVYFQSIYFRQPRGGLFEIATLTPGFFADETELGKRLCLPPWLESSRSSIEERLVPLGNTSRG